MPNAPDLFDVKRKALRPKPTPAPSGVIQHLIGLYRLGYEGRFGEPPVVLKRDGPILRGLVQQFGAAKVEQRLRAYLAWDDQFVVDSGYALTMFHACWNRLAARVCATTQQREMSSDRTDAYLRSLKSVVK